MKNLGQLSVEEVGVRMNSEKIAKLESSMQRQSLLTMVTFAALLTLGWKAFK